MTAELTITEDIEQADAGARRARSIRRAKIERALGFPPRPSTRATPEAGWMNRAACGTPNAPMLTEHRTQHEAAQDAAEWCAPCPVKAACLADGRAVHGSGLWGGFVLADGHLAPDRQGMTAYASAEPWGGPARGDLQLLPREVDLVALAGADGLTIREISVALFGDDAEARVRRAQRIVAALVKDGALVHVGGAAVPGGGRELGRYRSG